MSLIFSHLGQECVFEFVDSLNPKLTQTYDTDLETSAPAAKMSLICVLLSLTANLDCCLY